MPHLLQTLKDKFSDKHGSASSSSSSVGVSSAPSPPPTSTPSAGPAQQTAEDGETDAQALALPKVVGAYFVNWGIYARSYKPQQVPCENLTHIFYAFADVRPETGEVFLTDAWSDEQIHYEGDSWNDEGNNLYGNFKQFLLLKKQYRHLKLLLSIGGWTFAPHFAPMAKDAAKRAKFVSSAIEILENSGLDGIDIDWEYPADDDEAQNFVSLLKEVREGLAAHQAKKCEKNPYLLTIAAPCGEAHYKVLRIAEMDAYLDFWNLMAYDFAGSWDSVAGHQAKLFGEPPSVKAAVDYYVAQKAPAHKLVMGMPLYGRCFQNTDGPGSPYEGVGQGSWEAGNYDYKVLPMKGAEEKYDAKLGASWSYDSTKREFITYDTPEVVRRKCLYIQRKGMRGAMFWELSGDADAQHGGVERSLVAITAQELANLDQTLNHLEFPYSKWDNVRKGL
ncbi:Chitinase 4 [Thecaphora frezii]|nr:putative chitinase 1 [Thecaphora frezii]UOP57070.1 putative glycoside hydrolase family 18 protein [Thecaphora frezii]